MHILHPTLADNRSVAVVGREGSPHLEQIQKEGLTVITTGGSRNIPATKFSFVGLYLKSIPFPPGIIFLALKQPDLTEKLVRQHPKL